MEDTQKRAELMAADSLDEKLARAEANITKLCEFFAARREWSFDDESIDAARDLSAAADAVGVRVRTMMQACGAEPDDPKTPDVESLGPGTHDHARVLRFTAFLRELDGWFAAQTEAPTTPRAMQALQEMEAHVSCMIRLFEAALVPPEERDVAAAAEDGATRGATAGGLTSIVTDEKGAAKQLVLDDTEEHPLVQEFRGISELTPECERLADEFLAGWNIELSYYNRKKYLERLLRWISSAPEGQVLVIKMKTLEEPYEPYPSYVSRERLRGEEPPQEP
jgi:hypothetical protein